MQACCVYAPNPTTGTIEDVAGIALRADGSVVVTSTEFDPRQPKDAVYRARVLRRSDGSASLAYEADLAIRGFQGGRPFGIVRAPFPHGRVY